MTVSAIERQGLSEPVGGVALIVAAQFMVILDVAIVNVALPSMELDLGFSQSGLEWVVTAYAIVFGGFLLLGDGSPTSSDEGGPSCWASASSPPRRCSVGSRGRRARSSPSVGPGARWGAPRAGGAVAPDDDLRRRPRPQPRARRLGAASGSGAAVGVLLGGVLTSYLSWPWIFFINAPVGALLLVLTPRILRTRDVRGGLRHFDLAGALSATGSVMLLVYGLTVATDHGFGSTSALALSPHPRHWP